MLYELRVYVPHEGKADAMRARFLNQVIPIFARVGIDLVQVFAADDGSDRLVYLTRYQDAASRDAQWARFFADAEWAAVKANTERDGPLLKSQEVMQLAQLR